MPPEVRPVSSAPTLRRTKRRMSATDRTLVKPPEEQPEDPALRLDDASDRAVVLAGDVIDQLHGAGDVDQEDVEDLRRAAADVQDVLDEITAGADR